MKKLSFRKRAMIALGVLGLIGILFFVRDEKMCRTKKLQKTVTVEQQPWMTVFVHGSFGSLLSVLNAFQVMQDKVEGTSYKKVVGRMRKDPFFFREQPLLAKGLVKVTPSFDLEVTGKKKYAAYPFCKLYEEITEYVAPGAEKNYFYTFGWSGLLSQQRRCSEAVRFYNELSVELAAYHRKGIHPKVRVLTHSHGGNLVAYVGAIDEALRLQDPQEDGTLRAHECLCSLTTREEAGKKKGQKRWDYRPEKGGLVIDELILWGMPVQPETDYMFAKPAFKTVYHFYSDDDLVQRLDWVSTKKGYSDRRFAKKLFTQKSCLPGNRLVQSRILVNRNLRKRTTFSDASVKEEREKNLKKQESFWSILMGGGSILAPTSQDPTHKELWFFCWSDKKSDEREFILAPFPVAVFSPFFVRLLGQKPDVVDADINITKSEKSMQFELAKYDDALLQVGFSADEKFIFAMKEKVLPWRPKKFSSEHIFNLMRRYADYL